MQFVPLWCYPRWEMDVAQTYLLGFLNDIKLYFQPGKAGKTSNQGAQKSKKQLGEAMICARVCTSQKG